MTFFSCNALNTIPLKCQEWNLFQCVSMSNQECKVRPVIIVMSLHFIHIVFLWINAVAVVIILMIYILNYVFLMLLKT